MNIWKHRRFIAMVAFDLFVFFGVVFAGPVSRFVISQYKNLEAVADTGEQASDPHVGLVFVLTTGFEDVDEVEQCLRDVKLAKESGYVSDVTLIVQGRGLDALTNLDASPPQITNLAREVKASGVHIIVSDDEISRNEPGGYPDIVPTEFVSNGDAQIAELASKGYQIIRY